MYSVNSFISQVTLSKLLNLAQVQFHHLPNEGEDNDSNAHGVADRTAHGKVCVCFIKL